MADVALCAATACAKPVSGLPEARKGKPDTRAPRADPETWMSAGDVRREPTLIVSPPARGEWRLAPHVIETFELKTGSNQGCTCMPRR